jgi:hypothetical protein
VISKENREKINKALLEGLVGVKRAGWFEAQCEMLVVHGVETIRGGVGATEKISLLPY